ncbi:antitoxin VapB family protein [Candidatus Woesearchaeota archaeon]|nr:antitoxin VapB family protein [Candidatus Woesearchaeota archaeon]
MTTKTITIMEDAYELLRKAKKDDESFSDVIRRIANKETNIEKFFGVWSDEFADLVEKSILELRERNKEREKWRDEQFTA